MRRRRSWLLLIGLAIVAAAAIAPFACDGERLAMGTAAREKAPGKLAKLGNGTTHYELAGPESGPRVVLIHGVSGPMAVWDATVPRLAAAGFRVLRYDHFGRGYSDRIDAAHDLALYDRQLVELLDAVGWREPVAAVGSSMGGIVATQFAIAHPERVSRVVLVGPAGFPIELSLGARAMGVPYVGPYLMRTFGDRLLASHHRKYFVDPAKAVVEAAQAAFEEQLAYKGTKRSILSTMNHMPVNDFTAGYQRLGASAKPVLLVWGRDDRTIPFSSHLRALELVPQAKVVPIDAAAHLPQAEQVDAFASAVIPFLAGSQSEILDRNAAVFRAIGKRDVAALRELASPDFQFRTAAGQSGDLQAWLDSIAGIPGTIESVTNADLRLQQEAEHATLCGVQRAVVLVEGRRTTDDVPFCDRWERRGGRWLLTFAGPPK